MVNITVDEETIKRTFHCSKDFACLSGGFQECCKVEKCVGDLHYVKPCNDKMCIYQVLDGPGYVCNCPVRLEIYKKYKI